MTKEEAKKMLKAKLECLKRETSGTDIDCNYRNCDECNLCYEQGNMGEQKEALDMAIKALENKGYDQGYHEGFSDAVRVKKVIIPEGTWDILSDDDGIYGICSVCQQASDFSHYGVAFDFCPNCGADMRGVSE